MKKQNYPWVCVLAVICGGKNQNAFEMYGTNGTDKGNRPSTEQREKTQLKVRTQKTAEGRAKKKDRNITASWYYNLMFIPSLL